MSLRSDSFSSPSRIPSIFPLDKQTSAVKNWKKKTDQVENQLVPKHRLFEEEENNMEDLMLKNLGGSTALQGRSLWERLTEPCR